MYTLAVVDDNEAWCFVIANMFQQHGFKVSTYTEPLSFAREADQFDVALIDFSIPPRRYQKEMDGPGLISSVRESQLNSPLMILLSAYFTEDMLPDAAEICPEADACLSKSIGLEEIFRQVNQLLSQRMPVAMASFRQERRRA